MHCSGEISAQALKQTKINANAIILKVIALLTPDRLIQKFADENSDGEQYSH